MIIIISAIAGAYGAHVAREFLMRTHDNQAWTQIFLGALAGVISGEILNLAFPVVGNTLTDLTASVYLGTVIPYLIFGTLGGLSTLTLYNVAGRIKANQ
jgi:hypothetical protein